MRITWVSSLERLLNVCAGQLERVAGSGAMTLLAVATLAGYILLMFQRGRPA